MLKPVETPVFNIAVFHLSWGPCFFPKQPPHPLPVIHHFESSNRTASIRKKKQESRWIKRLFAWSMFLEATCNDLFLRSSVFKKREFLSWWVWQLENESLSFPTKLLHFLGEKSPKTPGNPSTNRQTPTNSGRPQLGMQFGNLIHQKLLFHDLGKLVMAYHSRFQGCFRFNLCQYVLELPPSQ